MHIRLEAYEGPMDLLLQLIERNRINIFDIPIAVLTDQYLESIQHLPPEMDGISEFLVMAATLLEIKSKMLLPQAPDPSADTEDPREALARKILEYKRFKEASDILREIGLEHPGYATRDPDANIISLFQSRGPEDLSELMPGVTPERLFRLFDETLKRRERRTDPIRGGFRSIPRDSFTVEAQMERILALASHFGSVSFADMMEEAGRAEIVATFLALLELIKQNRVEVRQPHLSDDIIITLKDRDAHG